jgi:hypothetical protein
MSPIAQSALNRALCCWLLVSVSGCHKAPTADAAAAGGAVAQSSEKAAGGAAGDRVSLKADEVEKIGIATVAAKSTLHAPETSGFGTVVAHEAIAQAVAELTTAVAIERQSRSAWARGQRLAGTPGAMPADTQEAAERQATVDQAALELARRRLSSMFGQNPPWNASADSADLSALANGTTKLVRVTFPIGALSEANPSWLRFSHINSMPGRTNWISNTVWSAPADASIPGRSFFALLKGSDVGEGERLLAWAPAGSVETGVQVPAAAVVISGGKWWCYIEEKPGVFVRTEIDTGMPIADGYFVTGGVSAGDKIVINSAGELLARDMNPSTAAD